MSDEGPSREELLAEVAALRRRLAALERADSEHERRLDEQRDALRESERRFRAIFERADIGIGIVDMAGIVVACNPKLCDLLDYTQDELCGARTLDLTHADDRALSAARLQEAAAGEIDGYRIEKRYLRKDGTPLWVQVTCSLIRDDQGRPQLLVGMLEDIGERRLVEDAMHRYAERLEALHEIDRGILAADAVDTIAQSALERLREFVPCHRASVALFDEEADEVVVLAVDADGATGLGRDARLPLSSFPVSEALRRGEVQEHDIACDVETGSGTSAHLRREGIRSTVNVPLIDGDRLIGTLNLGSRHAVRFRAEHVDMAREAATQLSVAIRQARLQENLRRHAETLEQRVEERTQELRERNTELESFAYTVSHDLRSPLRTMQTFASVLLDDFAGDFPPEARQYTERIAAAAARMDELISDLLEYARVTRTAVELGPVALAHVVSEVLEQIAGFVAERDAEVVVEPLPSVLGHHRTLLQVLGNLLSNAIKFVADGVRPKVVVRAEARGDRVRLWVEDNGIGIAPEYHERVFQVFERLHGGAAYAGTGIGLAIVHKSVRRMNGALGLESRPGEGSRFWLELPPA